MDNMNIAFFSPNLFGGGAERIISILATHFSRHGSNVDLLLGNASGPYMKDIDPAVNIIDFSCNKVMFALPKLVSYLRKNKPDVLFTSQMHSSIVALWAVKVARTNTRVIIRQPTMLKSIYQMNSLRSKFKQKILFWSARRWCHQVVVTSKAMAAEFISMSKISPSKVTVIYNPLPVNKICRDSVQPLIHPWFEEGQPPVILAVGRLVTAKDFSTLIKAFSLVKEQKTDSRLLILGEGPLRNELEQLAVDLNLRDSVEMPGFVDNPYRYMKKADVYVLSSLWEGFPNSLIEAMACGVDIVSTRCDGGAVEILEDGKWGQLVPPQNPVEMAKCILSSLNNPAEKSPSIRANNFSSEIILDLFEDLMAEREVYVA